jgi:DnaJ-class molecular chaperone
MNEACMSCFGTGEVVKLFPATGDNPYAPCPDCHGNGFRVVEECVRCKGLGEVANDAVDVSDYFPIPCPDCGGLGRIPSQLEGNQSANYDECNRCEGTGRENTN